MPRRVLTVTARVLFVICGVTSLFTGVPYVILRGVSLPIESEWIVFATALALVGFFSVVMGLLPRSWIAKLCRTEREDDRLFSAPLKTLGMFAALFYLFAVGVYFAPHTWNLNPQITLALCPMYFVKMTIDPPPVWILFLLAPMNAGVYGSVGVIAGYAWLAAHRRRAATDKTARVGRTLAG